jgi:GT2 family glycosyltransferase
MYPVIICNVNPAKFARIQQHYQQLFSAEPYELIGIHDARSLSEGYNRGIARAKGEFLIFSHDDIEFLAPRDWLARLKNHLSHFDVVGLAGTTKLTFPEQAWAGSGPPYLFGQVAHVGKKPNWPEPYQLMIFSTPASAVPGIQALDGMFLAVRREVLTRVTFDEKNFDHFHCYDLDFTFCTHLAGFKLAVACDMAVIHESSGNYGAEWNRAVERFILKHRSRLPQPHVRRVVICQVSVNTKEELFERMLLNNSHL